MSHDGDDAACYVRRITYARLPHLLVGDESRSTQEVLQPEAVIVDRGSSRSPRRDAGGATDSARRSA